MARNHIRNGMKDLGIFVPEKKRNRKTTTSSFKLLSSCNKTDGTDILWVAPVSGASAYEWCKPHRDRHHPNSRKTFLKLRTFHVWNKLLCKYMPSLSLEIYKKILVKEDEEENAAMVKGWAKWSFKPFLILQTCHCLSNNSSTFFQKLGHKWNFRE